MNRLIRPLGMLVLVPALLLAACDDEAEPTDALQEAEDGEEAKRRRSSMLSSRNTP